MKDTTQNIADIFAAQKNAVVGRRVSFDYDARIAAIDKLKAKVLDEADAICKAIYADFGKHPDEVMLTEIYPLLVEIGHTRKNLRRWMRPKRAPSGLLFFGTTAKVRPTPKGAALVLAPWNFPLLLALGPVVSALAAGCSVTLKPSEMTPNTSALLHRIITETFDADLFAVIEGGVGVATALLELPFDHIFFTGSPEVGQIVMTAASKTHASVTLELGGKSPAIVGPDANIKDAARWIAWGRLLNGGQACVCADHVYVHESVKDRFLTELTAQMTRIYGGTDERGSDDVARMVHAKHWANVVGLIDDARAKGAKVLLGGQSDEATRRIAPTVLIDVHDDMAIQQTEIFGPVLPVMPYQEIADVIAKMNDGPHPLALYIFGSNGFADDVTAQSQSGMVGVNLSVMVFAHPSAPFGGVGRSGNGGAHGQAGFAAFSHMRQVLKVWYFPFHRFFPPYNKRTKLSLRSVGRILR